MGKIKTRETVKNVKAIDKAAIAGARMKNAFIRSKDGTENLMDDRQVTPSEYAEDKVLYAAEDISHDTVHLAGSGIKTAANKGKEEFQRQRAEKVAEKLRERSSGTQPQTPTQTVPEQPQPTTTGTHTTTTKQTVSTPEVRGGHESRTTFPERHYPSQPKSVPRGYQPVSAESGTTLYSDADRMVEQGRQLAKKKAKQKAEMGRQIKRQTDRIAHPAEQTIKVPDISPGLPQSGESVRTVEQSAQSIGKSAQSVKSSARGVEQSAQTAKQAKRTAEKSIRSLEKSTHTIKQTAKSTGKATAKTAKGTIKTSRRAAKTAQQTSKAAIKTSQATAKTAQKPPRPR